MYTYSIAHVVDSQDYSSTMTKNRFDWQSYRLIGLYQLKNGSFRGNYV